MEKGGIIKKGNKHLFIGTIHDEQIIPLELAEKYINEDITKDMEINIIEVRSKEFKNKFYYMWFNLTEEVPINYRPS